MAVTTYDNKQIEVLDAGKAYYPVVALAFSYAVLEFTNGTAGAKRVITCGTDSITITNDANGGAVMSLLPFIRADVESRNVLNLPFGTPPSNPWRGKLTVSVSVENGTTESASLTIYYIYGDYAPSGVVPTEYWCDFMDDTTGGSYVLIDWADHYTNAVPNDLNAFRACWTNLNTLTGGANDGNTYNVLIFQGGKIVKTGLKYRLAKDCRTDGVRRVRWIDSNGNIHIRKLTLAGETQAGALGDSYQRPHDYKEITNGYDRGDDVWTEIAATRQITLGDDAIPAERFNDLREIATTPIIEVYENGAWTRCNVTDFSVERDYKKNTFTLNVTLTAPTYTVQKF